MEYLACAEPLHCVGLLMAADTCQDRYTWVSMINPTFLSWLLKGFMVRR